MLFQMELQYQLQCMEYLLHHKLFPLTHPEWQCPTDPVFLAFHHLIEMLYVFLGGGSLSRENVTGYEVVDGTPPVLHLT